MDKPNLVKPRASAFIQQMKSYNKHDINKDIANFEKELKKTRRIK